MDDRLLHLRRFALHLLAYAIALLVGGVMTLTLVAGIRWVQSSDPLCLTPSEIATGAEQRLSEGDSGCSGGQILHLSRFLAA